ncbi:hypothetical protein RHMOL_Rhmol01G0074300 [Rhododendron molle]|uniref:Uncharacterized protein n=1 Tax=Rhododendron molle TaxID=49168 RepID=A0ACC0Q292_RHOML|nr:hypothetical protein RHMOL_Rhmol01G0074300 [Rhododendron molle]
MGLSLLSSLISISSSHSVSNRDSVLKHSRSPPLPSFAHASIKLECLQCEAKSMEENITLTSRSVLRLFPYIFSFCTRESLRKNQRNLRVFTRVGVCITVAFF